MTKFVELIKSNAWLSVELTLLEIYPDEKNNIEGYKNVFDQLQFLSPTSSDVVLEVKWVEDSFDNTKYVDVSGKYVNPQTEEQTFSQGLGFQPWNQWLAMDITAESLESFHDLEIVAYCLFEMTFYGFVEDEIQDILKSLDATVDEYKNMTKEEKEASTTSIEDLLKELEEDTDED